MWSFWTPALLHAQSVSTNERPLADALIELATLSNVDLLFDPKIVSEHSTRIRLNRRRPFELQLQELLSSTNLTYRRLASGSYVVTRRSLSITVDGRLAGRVVDKLTGEPLPGAHVLLADLTSGTATDAGGSFAFSSLEAGRYLVSASFVGYGVQVDTVDVLPASDTEIAIELRPQPVRIPPMIIEADDVFSSFRGFGRTVNESELAQLRGLGTPDAVRSLNQMLGVRVGDALADVYVQGGESGEHQFRLDGVPVFEPVHLRGLLGAFNPFALEKITIHKAGFSAAHGSHLSGVLLAEHKLVNAEGRTLDAQVDPLSLNARLHVEQEWSSGTRAHLMGAVRTSLWSMYQPERLHDLFREWNTPDDFLLRYSLLSIQDDALLPSTILASLGDSVAFPTVTDPDLGFTDVHLAARLRFAKQHTLHASFYRGWNRLNGNRLTNLDIEAPTLSDEAERVFQDSPQSDNRDDYTWVNLTAQVQHSFLLSPQAYWKNRLRFNRYRLSHAYNTIDNDGDLVKLLTPEFELREARVIEDIIPTDDGNGIREWAFESTLDLYHATDSYLRLGVEAIQTHLSFNIEDVYFRPITHKAITERLAFFAEEDWQLSDRWHLSAGLRSTWLASRQTIYAEPRFRLLYQNRFGVERYWSARLATGLYRQFINQFDVSSVSPSALLPAVRFWLPVDSTIAPPKAFHVAGDIVVQPSASIRFRVEGFYKNQPHVLQIDYPALWESLLDETPATDQSDFLASADGFSYGTSIGVEYMHDLFNAGVAYDYTVAKRTQVFLDETKRIAAPWNEPHRLQAVMDWSVQPSLTGTIRWRGGWGRTWAFRQAYYDYLANDPVTEPIFGDFNILNPESHKLKSFSQLDVGAAFTRELGETALQVRLDVLNVLDRANEADWSLVGTVAENEETAFHKSPRYLLPRTFSAAFRVRW